MIVLALDSTETTVTAAITNKKRLVAQTVINAKLNHSENLLPCIEFLMRGAGLSYDDIEVFAASSGPGSFTGVRIGISTLKGLAFNKNKPCVTVSALESMAYNFLGFEAIVCPVMDARRNQLYNAIFKINGNNITRLTEDRVIIASDLAEELSNYNDLPIYFCGGGYGIILEECLNKNNISETPELLKYQNAYSVAMAAIDKYNSEGGSSDVLISPSYLRPSSAEINRKKQSDKEK